MEYKSLFDTNTDTDTLLSELSSTTTSASNSAQSAANPSSAPNDQISPQVYQSSQPYAPGMYHSVNQLNQSAPLMPAHQQQHQMNYMAQNQYYGNQQMPMQPMKQMQYMHSMAPNHNGQAAPPNAANPANFNLAKGSQFMGGQGQPPWSQYGGQQAAGAGPNAGPYAKPVIMGQNQQTPNFKQMNQFGQSPKPSPPPVSPQLPIQPNQSYPMPPPQYQGQKLMPHSAAQIQPTTNQPSTYAMQMPYQNSQKLSSLPPHMQQPYTAQVYANQGQPRAQLMPNQYQASPNKINPNMPPAANMYQSNAYALNQQQTSPNQTYYQSNPQQQQQQQQQYSPYYTSNFSASNQYPVMNTPTRMNAQNYSNFAQPVSVTNSPEMEGKPAPSSISQISPQNSLSPQTADLTPKRSRSKTKSKSSDTSSPSNTNNDEENKQRIPDKEVDTALSPQTSVPNGTCYAPPQPPSQPAQHRPMVITPAQSAYPPVLQNAAVAPPAPVLYPPQVFNQSQFNIKPQPAVAPVFAPILPKPDASSAQNGAENAAAQSPKKVRAIKPKVEEESVSASTQSKIDATIDDFMKKYKMKDLSASESEPADDDDDNDDDKKDSDFDASDSKDDEGRVEQPKKSRSKKKKEQGDAQVDATRKKRKYTRKKIKNLPQNESTQDTTATVETVQPDYCGGGDDEKKSRKKDSSFVVSAASRARRKSAFVKLMQKNKRKKRKKTSSDEEAESDDSDGFELSPAVVSRAKREEINSQEDTTNGAAGDEVQSDETTAKLLQAGEKRRSTRCVKRQKYSDTAIKDEDLLLPAPPPSNDQDQVAESSQKKGNIEFATSDTLVVDKILGIRLFKRKTRRRIEKTNNETGEKAEGEREPVESGDDKMELSEAAAATAATAATAGEENKENLEESKSEERGDKKENDGQEELEEEASEYETDGELEVEEFYVKYKNLSYLHCEWRSRDELFYSDKRIDQKIKRFRVKKQQSQVYDWDDPDTNNSHNGYNNDYDELFNPDYVIIDRILDEYEADDLQKPGNRLKYFLVKWKALAYDESSWELESDIKNVKKIERFRQINTMVADIHLKHVCKPKVDRWNKLSQSRVYKNDNRIREYQLEGINWLIFCWLNGRNCILADEMGLGKTVQSITFLQEVAYYGITGPSLILVPLSTIGNWIREFETWTDFNVIVYHGSTVSRQMIQDYEFYFKEADGSKSKKIVKFNALITTYEVLMSDVPLFCSFKWRNLIIDEAHRLKNKNCKLIEGLRYMDIEHKVLLTGTPLQNNVEELFSLLNFLEPQQFHSSAEFMQEYGELKTDVQVQSLQAVLKPMMLRRLKEDVEKNLKPKEETIVEVELTNTQKKYYRAILERNFQFLTRGASSANVPNLMNTMMELRKCCNHPYLIDGAEDQIIAEYMERYRIENQERASLQAMVQASGKLVLVDKLLPKLKAGGHRVLIFSQMIRVLDILEDYLIQMRFTYERLDGRIRGEARQEAIDRYSKPDSDRFAFLLCTRAGGLGINLTAADTVIIYDSDWNPQNDLQAQARVHRIGQQKSVKIYRLVTRNTYEREMFDRASLKLGLDKAILQSMRNEDKFNAAAGQNSQMTKKEIEDLLKKGAYGALMEDDTAADKFCEEDIDKILQQRSTVIQIEGGQKGSTFSKASFQTSETSDIALDDPDFWQKWAKKAEIDLEDKLNPKDERIIYEPRRRTQTRRYGGPDDVMDESDYSSSDSDETKEQRGDKKRKKRRGRPGADDAPFKGCDDAAAATANEDDEEPSVWTREECYKVEKLLLIFGWSRWSKILDNLELSSKRRGAQVQSEQDVENLSRTIIAFTIKNYTGDDTIKQFVLDLIDPSKSNFADLKNHQGLAAPVVRGRRPRPLNQESHDADAQLEWAKNAEELLGDENYKKHLIKQANKILLRLRMLFYIKSEMLGDEYAARLDADDAHIAHHTVDLALPDVQFDLPADWWDKACDSSLVLGVYKHGFEKYNLMRSDPKLVFLSLCGPPDHQDLLAEQNNEERGDMDTHELLNRTGEESAANVEWKKFPSVSEMNNRLRRLIATVQKSKKQEQLVSKRNAERQEKRLSKMAVSQERAQAKQIEKQTKWSRREEQNFYKTISVFGVDCLDKDNLLFSWDKFREIGQLERKLDDTLTDYYLSFVYMCKKVAGKLSDEDSAPVIEVPVEPISEERATRCLQRIDMMNKLRLQILKSDAFDQTMSKCTFTADLPDWYVPGKHDKELVLAAAKHGLARSDHYFYNDEQFSFKADLAAYAKHIERLIDQDNKHVTIQEHKITDPVQFYFQNQARIQTLFKKQQHKDEDKEEDKEEDKDKDKDCATSSFDKEEIDVKQEDKSEIIDTSQKELVIDETEEMSPEKKSGQEKIDPDDLDLKSDVKNENNTKIDVDDHDLENDVKIDVDDHDLENDAKNENDVKIDVDDHDLKNDAKNENDIKIDVNTHEHKNDAKNENGAKIDVHDHDLKNDEKKDNSYFQLDAVPLILWPKDRVILNRLENIITLFETDEWPAQKLCPNGLLPSASNSQLSVCNPLSISNLVQSPNIFLTDNCSVEDDDDNLSHDNDSEYGKGSSGSIRPKRGRPPKYDQYGFKSLDAIDENNTSKFLEPGEIMRPKPCRSKTQLDSENSDASSSSSSTTKPSNRKSRKKENNDAHTALMNPNDLAALAALFMASGQDPDERIAVINMTDGTKLTGSKAPKRAELPLWLLSHPNYLPDEQEILNMTMNNSTFQTCQADVKKSDQTEPNSSSAARSSNPSSNGQLILYNKLTNKRVNSAKVPQFKHLASFLEKNEQIYIDTTCSDLVRAKFGNKMPDIVKSRLSSGSKSQKSTVQPSPSTTPKPNGSGPKSKQTPKPASNNQQLNDLFNTSGSLDMNNPLAGFMAAALAGQSGASNMPFGNPAAFNPFLLPPFAPPMPGMPNPMDFLKDLPKMPSGIDISQLDEFTSQLAAMQNMSSGLSSPAPKAKETKPAGKSKAESRKSMPCSSSTPDVHKETKHSTPSAKNSHSKVAKAEQHKSAHKPTNKANETKPDFSSLAAAMSQFDPANANNLTALASMMEQEKLLQEMINFSQFNPTANPFMFNGPFGQKNAKNKSPSPDRAHSLSPALSVSSNLSSAQQQQSHALDMANNPDLGFLMSNLMNFGAGANMSNMTHGLMPPPPFGLAGTDFSKLPAELLSALSAQSGALDPSMFSALAQLNSFSSNATNEEKSKSKSTKPGGSSGAKLPVKTPQQKSQSNNNGKKRENDEHGLDLSIKKNGKSESDTKRVRQSTDE